MDAKSYIELKEAAEKWNISVRRVQVLCADGRIPGVVRMGRDWMIPNDAVKPTDGRTKAGREKQTEGSAEMPMPKKTPFLYMTNLYYAPGCAESAIAALEGNPEAQTLLFAELACAKGEIDTVYERANYLLQKHSGFYAILAAGTLLAQCAIWRGDLAMWRTAKIHIAEANARNDIEREIITLSLCAVDSMLYDVKNFPDWFKIGCFEMLHKDSLPAAKVYYAKYIYARGHGIASKTFKLEGVQGLALMGLLPATIEPMISQAMADNTVIAEIYLRLTCAVTYHYTTVTVVNENGVLRIFDVENVNTKNTGETDLEFINTYVLDGEDEITLRGTKMLKGDRTQVNENEFEFGLYDADGKLIESVKNDADGNFVFTALKFDEKDVPVNGSKQITYTVKEIAGSDVRVTYDEIVYTVVVTVEDNEQGGVTASYTVNDEADGLISFTNVYTRKPDDVAVDIDVVKTVVNKGSEKIGPEGFEFLLKALTDGVADMTVKSDANGKAKITLNFTEADIGKVYTYKLTEIHGDKPNVTYSDAEYTITVAIKLNANNKLVAILTKNSENVTEVIAEFENIYDYTPTPEPPEIPETGDDTNLHLWFTLLFVSGAVIVTMTVCDIKKNFKEF